MIKRRTLLYSLIVLIVGLLTLYVAKSSEIGHENVDVKLTWTKFVDDFGGEGK